MSANSSIFQRYLYKYKDPDTKFIHKDFNITHYLIKYLI